ncbi:MAG TPA: hypothetical protein VF284_07850 [Rhodanobacteraceae bacterium]
MKKLLAIGIAGVLATGLSCSAFAQTGASTEVTTAHAHALMAQNAKSLTEAHAHLHHVVNCLVGPKGHGFDASAEDPCKGQGNGAIPDSSNDHAMHAKLEHALKDAKAGLKSNKLAKVQKDAGKAASNLQGGDTAAAPPASSSSW